jgi:hypothetical protein
MGGNFSIGPKPGNYRVIVNDAQNGESGTGRPNLKVEFVGRNDPNNPAKEGKKIIMMFQSYPLADQDPDKAESMKGFWKRLIYDGFGLSWGKQAAATGTLFDVKLILGKEVWIQLGQKSDGKMEVRAIALKLEGLPKLQGGDGRRGGGEVGGGEASGGAEATAPATAPAASGRRR